MAGPFEVDEDIRPLTAAGSTRSTRRRHLGPSSSYEACSSRLSSLLRGRPAIVLGLLTVGVVYLVGRERGQSLRFGEREVDVQGKKDLGRLKAPSVPTYQPTEKGTDPPVPTYDPTKAGTLPPTPRPTFGDASYIPTPNPYIDKFNTMEWQQFNAAQWEQRYQNSLQIKDKFGTYCPNDPAVPMCPLLNDQQIISQPWNVLLSQGPSTPCIQTGDKTARCGVENAWLNKTIWPMIRGPFCVNQNNQRKNAKFTMPDELLPYYELGYDRNDPMQSTDAASFDGGSSNNNNNDILWFDPDVVKDHFLKFEAMLEYYYEGLSLPLLEDAIMPNPTSALYAPMLQQYADQIARALLRRKEHGENNSDDGIVIGVLGDSVTSGTDNCYFDAWPEQLRRQMSPIFESMGIKIEIRNAAKNGGWLLAPQMLCVNDMLGASDRKDDVGLDFLIQVNPFVHAHGIDAEHMIRRALFGPNPTLVALTVQDGMDAAIFMKRYATAGLIVTTEPGYKLPELNFPIPGHSYWFPDPGRGFWGMQSDGFCRISTRAGSAPVVKRNWHWGPLVHQTYADAWGLLFSRAARQAIDDLAAGRMPRDPPSIDDYERILNETTFDDKTQVYKKFLVSDMDSNEYSSEGLGGVRCAVGSANQPGSTLMHHWLNPAEGTPFEATMKARGGVSFVPDNHNAVGGTFYKIQAPISPPNNAVEKGDWIPNPAKFSEEAPRTADQCKHVDGSTMINFPANKPEGSSWLVWKVPERAVSVGRLMICQQRGATMPIAEDAFDTKNVRFHYAVSDANGNWKVVEDTQKNENKQTGDDCIVMVNDMDANDKAAAFTSGMWVAVEWVKEGIFDFDYLVAM